MSNKKKREKLSIFQAVAMFGDEEKTEQWFIENRWGNKIICPKCYSDKIFERKNLKRKTWRCKSCKKDFTTRTGTLMEASNLRFQQWALSFYLVSTNLKGIPSTRLASELKITQKAAWHLGMRIRETLISNNSKLSGVVEIDETYIGGKEQNKHASKRMPHTQGKSTKTKSVVIGIKERDGDIVAMPIPNTTRKVTHKEIEKNIAKGSQLYTDDARQYVGGVKGYNHQSVNHSVKQFVNGQAHTNGIESFWAMLKRGHYGTYHSMSRKHLKRYINEFAGRHNIRKLDTIKQLECMVKRMNDKRLRYKDLIS